MANNSTKLLHYKEIRSKEDSDGKISSSTVEKTSKIGRSGEPDYIKLYTKVWCEFNEIPLRLRDMFLELAVRMSYADSTSPDTSQTVYTGKPISNEIMRSLNIKQATYNQYLRELVECNAIKRVNRGVYQINPNYAARGHWKYNPTLKSGGIEDLIATFNFRDKTVDTKIIWSDDQKNNDYNKNYRKAFGANATVKVTQQVPKTSTSETPEIDGQIDIGDTAIPF